MYPPGQLPSFETPIVPKATIAGRALIAVVAIMTFLASLTTGAVMLVRSAASDWQSEVAREVTIQVIPAPDREIEADVTKAAAVARGRPASPMCGPIPRRNRRACSSRGWGPGSHSTICRCRASSWCASPADAPPDLAQLRKTLAEQVPSASLDDHRGFVDRMRTMAQAAVAAGMGVLILVLIATMLSVTFATRGAMATNRPVIEVLHFIGAKDNFIARHFQRHFLLLGLKGGAIGGGGALLLFALAELADRWFRGSAAGQQFAALFGSFSIGWQGYAAVVAQVVLIAGVTALTSRMTVNRMLATIH